MDLRVSPVPPSASERAALDAVLGPPPSGWSGGERSVVDGHVAYGGWQLAQQRRSQLLPALHALQERVGWISEGALAYLCTRLDLPPADAFGVASAYAMLRLAPGPATVVHVCDDVACRAAGADPDAFLAARGDDGDVAWVASPCLGHCEHGSAALVQQAGTGGGRATIAPFDEARRRDVAQLGARVDVARLAPPAALVPQAASDAGALRLLRRVGRIDPTSLDAYRAAGGYSALRRALELGPAGVISELQDARLVGRGGAAYPTAAKWAAVAANPVRPHYFVANADESEPGTFKDRVLLDGDPFALVEALTIAGITTGAERGFVYLRGEYPLAERRLVHAVAEASRRGLLGDDVMGSGSRFDIEVRRGAGAYIAGEETALFNSVEGRRPEPRSKPPYPVERGLFGRPTGVNNVETLLCVLDILSSGATAFASIGTAGSTGTRLFCLSGRVSRPGLYEVPLGTTLRSLVDLAGGVRDGADLAAVLLGGAAGGFVGPGELDLPLSFEGARAAGVALGSGVVVVLDDSSDAVGLVRRIARFFRDESCGQCVPCRVGTQRQEELLSRLAAGRPLGTVADELALLGDLDAVLRDASICGLGQTASAAVGSALRLGLLGAGGEGN